MPLVDENAFGLLIAFFDLEDVEYASERDDFVTRVTEFTGVVLDHATSEALGVQAVALGLGHAVYFEIGDGDQSADLIGWLRALRGKLLERAFAVTAVLSHGGRWVDDGARDVPEVSALANGLQHVHFARPSEPLRRALAAETATHGTDGGDGWGAGLYIDTEAVQALGKSLKNAPTPLAVAGATFYRIGS